ncbi:hypothetical protein QYF36_026575 [Acer negundo]|nr:hypothetical protein QYF36_026575 [Acer negundo]
MGTRFGSLIVNLRNFQAIWESRNSLLNYGKAKELEMVVPWARELLTEFLNSRQALSFPSPSSSARPSTVGVAPLSGMLKLNTKAAVCKISSRIGVGG